MAFARWRACAFAVFRKISLGSADGAKRLQVTYAFTAVWRGRRSCAMRLRIGKGPWRMQWGRLAAALLLLLCAHVFAHLPSPVVSQAPSTPPEAHVDPYGRTTPRGTVTGFIRATQRGDFAGATRFMQVPTAQSPDAEPVARQLKELMDRYYVHSIESISDKPAGNVNDGLPLDRQNVGTLKIGSQKLDILLIHVHDPEGGQIWVISSRSEEH